MSLFQKWGGMLPDCGACGLGISGTRRGRIALLIAADQGIAGGKKIRWET
jgi:hypothetical protein